MEKTGFWSRVGRWLKAVNGGAPLLDADDHQPNVVVSGDDHAVATPLRDDAAGNGRRRAEKCTAVAVSPDLERLTLSIREFLDGQTLRTERLEDHFAAMADHLTRLARDNGKQVDLLKEMNRRWEVETTARQSLDQKLAHLPSLADAQRECMVSITRHLEAGRESLERQTTALTELRAAVDAVGDATGASTRVVQQLMDQAEDREQGSVELLHALVKRLTVLGIVLVSLAAISALFALLALIR